MYPRTIDDGIGARITFLGVPDDVRARCPAPSTPAPARRCTSTSSRPRPSPSSPAASASSSKASPEQFAGPGDTVHLRPRRRPPLLERRRHRADVTGEVLPADNLEYFLTQVYASTAAHGGRPGAFDGAFLLTRYRTEFAMTEIPAPVRRFVFPSRPSLGRLLGRYARYADAPAPVSPEPGATLTGRTDQRP